MPAHPFPASIRRALVAGLAALAAGAALQAAPASAITIPSGQPGETGSELPPYSCGGCVSPAPADWDQDGLRDSTETFGFPLNGHRVKTDAADPDTDGDGLTDGDEAGTPRPERRSHGDGTKPRAYLDPTKWDTDGDGHSDGLEVKYTKTDPNTWDTDGDRLSDGAEGMTYRTNARRADTDGDCRSDGEEVRAGTNPRVYTTTPIDACHVITRARARQLRALVTTR